jgi:hypothetical protein
MEVDMSTHRKAALLALAVGLAFIATQFLLGVQTGLAGLFITGMAGGLVLGGELDRPAAGTPASRSPIE